MRIKRGGLQLAVLVAVLVSVLAVSLACSSKSEATPAATAAPAVSPTAAPTPTKAVPTAAPVAKPLYGGNLKWGGLIDVKSLDPAGFQNNNERSLGYLMYNTLVKFGPDFNVLPDLAKSWQISADGKDVTFTLQQGVKFQDGTTLDADAVKYNFDRLIDTNTISTHRGIWTGQIASIEVKDSSNVVFHLKSPSRAFLTFLADILNGGGISSPTALKAKGKDYPASPVGTGPYMLETWKVDNSITMVPNKGYWEAGPPYLDKVTDVYAADETIRVAMLRTGELDIQDAISPFSAGQLKTTPNLIVSEYPSCRFSDVTMAAGRAPWDNKLLRQAVAYSIDRNALIQTIEKGAARPGYSPLGDCFWYSNSAIKAYDYNVAKAKEALAQAGYPNGIDVDWQEKSTATDLEAAQVYQSMFAQVGIRTHIQTLPVQDFFAVHWTKRSLYFYKSVWVPRADPDGILRVLFYSKGSSNFEDYNNPQVDALLDQAAVEYDHAKAKALYDQIQKLMVEGPSSKIVTYLRTEFTGISTRVQNYVEMPDRMPRLGYIWLKQ